VSDVPRRLVALTFDYETWQPIPPGKQIDWEVDVFAPAERLIEGDVPVTLFAEMGEYFWLDANDAAIARRMEAQWRDTVRRGHDVQLHLHTAWLPECGATHVDGEWHWDARYAKADDYPGDLDALIERCVARLHDVLRPVDPNYRVTCFRAGAYQAQPFRRLSAALVRAGIQCDSSVYAGGVSAERGYDYSYAYSDGQPYFASPWDPQLRGAPAETELVELPIAVERGTRVMLDGAEGTLFDRRILRRDEWPTRHGHRKVAAAAGAAYARLRPTHRLLNLALPTSFARLLTPYGMEQTAVDSYTVAIGHTKGDLRVDDVIAASRRLVNSGYEAVTLARMAELARADLLAGVRSQPDESAYQVKRERMAVLGDERNDVQSGRLQRLIPLDRERVLDLGCGAGYWSERIAHLYPWMRVVGADVGEEFIAAARERHGSDRVAFTVADFTALPFEDSVFDCIYADNSLEHAYDVDASLREANRVLSEGGVLVAAIPSDARNPANACDNHTWKTWPEDVRRRFEAAGFRNVTVDEVDTFRRLGLPPFAPSDNRLMYVTAWKRDRPATQLQRAKEGVAWLHDRLDPRTPTTSNDPVAVIAGGVAFCAGYAVALLGLLDREGVDANIVQMTATDHPRGSGADDADTHVVVQASLDGNLEILDAMAGTIIPHGIDELLAHPDLATGRVDPDERYVQRGYALYDTAFWYSRVSRFRVYRSRLSRWRRNPHRAPVG
jgi:SAM-dependent methyltransferase